MSPRAAYLNFLRDGEQHSGQEGYREERWRQSGRAQNKQRPTASAPCSLIRTGRLADTPDQAHAAGRRAPAAQPIAVVLISWSIRAAENPLPDFGSIGVSPREPISRHLVAQHG